MQALSTSPHASVLGFSAKIKIGYTSAYHKCISHASLAWILPPPGQSQERHHTFTIKALLPIMKYVLVSGGMHMAWDLKTIADSEQVLSAALEKALLVRYFQGPLDVRR